MSGDPERSEAINPYRPPKHDPIRGDGGEKAGVRAVLGWLGPIGLVLAVAAILMDNLAGYHDHDPWWRIYDRVWRGATALAVFSGLMAAIAGRGKAMRMIGLGAFLVALIGFVATVR